MDLLGKTIRREGFSGEDDDDLREKGNSVHGLKSPQSPETCRKGHTMEFPISPSKPQHFFNIRGISPTQGERFKPEEIKGRRPLAEKMAGSSMKGVKFFTSDRKVA